MKPGTEQSPAPEASPQMVYWEYGPPPSELDLVRNHPAARAVRIVLHMLLRAYLRVFHRYRVRRGGRLARLRGHLIVANHASHLDALVLMSAFPLRRVNRVRSLCAKDYFFRHRFHRIGAGIPSKPQAP